jgi:DNA (cytosine-5)-methyltransferase 1
MGYHRAGFEVVGVDIEPQPRYPFEFHQGDVFAYLLANGWEVVTAEFDAIHASPPCQFGTAYKRRPDHVRPSENVIPQTRRLIAGLGIPYVIENNWTNRAHLVEPVRLCGSSFGLDVQRHRAFESSVPMLPPPCDHGWQTPRFPPATNRTNLRRTVEVGAWRTAHLSPAAMGIDWMTNDEISEAIPPAYTEWIGAQLLRVVEAAA